MCRLLGWAFSEGLQQPDGLRDTFGIGQRQVRERLGLVELRGLQDERFVLRLGRGLLVQLGRLGQRTSRLARLRQDHARGLAVVADRVDLVGRHRLVLPPELDDDLARRLGLDLPTDPAAGGLDRRSGDQDDLIRPGRRGKDEGQDQRAGRSRAASDIA